MARKHYYITGACAAILLAIFVIYASKKLTSLFRAGEKAWQYDKPPTYTLTSDDSSLIGKKYIDTFNVDQVMHFAGRQPVSFLEFDTTYKLLILKINANAAIPLRKMLRFDMVPYIDESFSVPYSENVVGDFKLLLKDSVFKEDASRIIDSMRLDVIGDRMKIIVANDSLISYTLFCNSFAIRYPPRKPFDVISSVKDGFGSPDEVKVDMLLYKRGNALYFLFATAEGPAFTLPGDLLYKIVTNQ